MNKVKLDMGNNSQLRKVVKVENVPVHLAIIPDGNRRWAKARGLEIVKGHSKSAEIENVSALLGEAQRLGVKYVSIWGFSTENWNRPELEKKFLFKLLVKSFTDFLDYAHENKIRVRHIGRKDRLPKEVIASLEKLEKETAKYKEFNVNFCMDYGGRDELIRAVGKMLKEGKKGVDEISFVNYLDTFGIPDVDLIIRTSGEQRTSGFMPFQSVYSELYFSEKYFPDFSPEDLRLAVEWFGNIKRNFGK